MVKSKEVIEYIIDVDEKVKKYNNLKKQFELLKFEISNNDYTKLEKEIKQLNDHIAKLRSKIKELDKYKSIVEEIKDELGE